MLAEPANQKLRGGYYTPEPIAAFLADWVVRSATDTVLEPSCGDGALLAAATRRLLQRGATPENAAKQIQGIELYGSEAEQTRAKLRGLGIESQSAVWEGDFFNFDDGEWGLVGRQFDAVIGNPPFLRYHSFPEEQRTRAFRIMRTAGLNPTRLTNAWVPFLIGASLRLTDTGRLAMVIPAELLQVKYAEETRAFLVRHFGALTIVTFRRLVFPDIQQEVVLLLAEKRPENASGIDVVEMEDACDLAEYAAALRARPHRKTIDHAREKWTQYYLEPAEIELLREAKRHPLLARLGQIGCVDVGVVTGNNSHFVLSEAESQAWNLGAHTIPLVARTAQLPGIVYTRDEWNSNRIGAIGCHLLNLPDANIGDLPEAARAYVEHGETSDAHIGFKCRNRKRWYIVPSLWVPDAFLFRQIHAYPKMVTNAAGATSTDTIHRVRFHVTEQGPQIAGAFLNSLTFAFSEVMGAQLRRRRSGIGAERGRCPANPVLC